VERITLWWVHSELSRIELILKQRIWNGRHRFRATFDEQRKDGCRTHCCIPASRYGLYLPYPTAMSSPEDQMGGSGYGRRILAGWPW